MVCFQISKGCSWWTFGGCFEPSLLRSLPVKKRLCSFHSLVVAMVDTTSDAFDNIGISLKDVVGTVVFLLDAIAKVVSARDALENNGTFTKMSTVQ